MKLRISIKSTREYVENIQLNKSFLDCVDEEEEYNFRAVLNMYNGKQLVATLHGLVFDEDKIINDGYNLKDIADMHYQDVYLAMQALIGSKVYKEELDLNKALLSPYSCYIETFYIYPKYRNKGIARYILNNLYDIFLHCLNINTRCFVTCPKPQQPEDKCSWINYPDEDGTMKKLMIDVIKKAGFKCIGKTEFYAINCMAEK